MNRPLEKKCMQEQSLQNERDAIMPEIAMASGFQAFESLKDNLNDAVALGTVTNLRGDTEGKGREAHQARHLNKASEVVAAVGREDDRMQSSPPFHIIEPSKELEGTGNKRGSSKQKLKVCSSGKDSESKEYLKDSRMPIMSLDHEDPRKLARRRSARLRSCEVPSAPSSFSVEKHQACVITNVRGDAEAKGREAHQAHHLYKASEVVAAVEREDETVWDKEVVEVDGAAANSKQLEDLDEQYVNVNLEDDDFSRADNHHQAEAGNITLVDNFEPGLPETDVPNRFERFDIADDETTVNITPDEHRQVPSTLIPSPPRQEDPPQQQEPYYAAPSPVQEEPHQGGSFKEHEEQKMKRKQPYKPSEWEACQKLPQVSMDNDNMSRISAKEYETWVKNASNLVSERRKVNNKISDLMDMPPVALMSFLDKASSGFYYPKPLVELWKESTEVKSSKASSSVESSNENGATKGITEDNPAVMVPAQKLWGDHTIPLFCKHYLELVRMCPDESQKDKFHIIADVMAVQTKRNFTGY